MQYTNLKLALFSDLRELYIKEKYSSQAKALESDAVHTNKKDPPQEAQPTPRKRKRNAASQCQTHSTRRVTRKTSRARAQPR